MVTRTTNRAAQFLLMPTPHQKNAMAPATLSGLIRRLFLLMPRMPLSEERNQRPRRHNVGGVLMSASLLHAIEATGIRLQADGNHLRVEVPPGTDLASFRERIRQHKTEILAALGEREEIARLTTELERGWCWMQTHPNHPKHDAFLERWIGRLRAYERVYRAHERITA